MGASSETSAKLLRISFELNSGAARPTIVSIPDFSVFSRCSFITSVLDSGMWDFAALYRSFPYDIFAGKIAEKSLRLRPLFLPRRHKLAFRQVSPLTPFLPSIANH